MSNYKPEYLLINWSKGSVVGCGTEAECSKQLEKCIKGDVGPDDAYILAAVELLSEMKRVET